VDTAFGKNIMRNIESITFMRFHRFDENAS